jgi:hypothetical protein
MNTTRLLIFVLGLMISLSAVADSMEAPVLPSSTGPACSQPGGKLASPQWISRSPSCQTQCDYGGIVACTDQSPYQYCESGSDYVFCYSTGYITCADCYPRIYCWG